MYIMKIVPLKKKIFQEFNVDTISKWTQVILTKENGEHLCNVFKCFKPL